MNGKLIRLTYIFLRMLYKGKMKRADKILQDMNKIMKTYRDAC